MSTLIADIRYSVRSLLKNPGLTLAAVLSLGLGIGANTTIFTWVQAVLFRPIPVAADPGSLRIAAMENREGQSRSWSYPNFKDFRDRVTMMDVVAQDDQTYQHRRRSNGGARLGRAGQRQLLRGDGRCAPPRAACSRPRTTSRRAVIPWR